jgi:hypothetical protein
MFDNKTLNIKILTATNEAWPRAKSKITCKEWLVSYLDMLNHSHKLLCFCDILVNIEMRIG